MKRVAAVAIVVAMTVGGLLSAPAQAASDYSLTIYFKKAISLFKSSEVRVLGLPAGTVTQVKVDGDRVRVVVKMKGSIPVPADVHATIVPQSLIGERYVQLFPVWTNGQPKARNGDIVPLDRSDVPVEPDEALAALKHLLDTLDPDATGRLVKNLSADLDGNGQHLNDALAQASDLVATLADKDEQLGSIIDNFDDFTATLRTRESLLGRTMDLFARTTGLLADERRTIESLVSNLAGLSQNGLDLVSKHRAALDKDLTVLTRTLQSVRANLDSVEKVLDSGPLLVKGTEAAIDPNYHRLDLRTQLSPTIGQLLGVTGTPLVCIPVDVNCVPLPVAAPGTAPAQPAAVSPAPAPAARAASPIDALVGLLGSSNGQHDTVGVVAAPSPARASDAAARFGRFVRRAARLFMGTGS